MKAEILTYAEQIRRIIPEKIKLNFGDIVSIKNNSSEKFVSSKYKGMIVGNYPDYILIKVSGKSGTYLTAINKVDLFIGDCEIQKIG